MKIDELYFWAKTTQDGTPGIDVFHHTLNVGYVASLIADSRADLMERFDLKPSVVAVLAAFHDIGKISQRFQIKCSSWAGSQGIDEVVRAQGWSSCLDDHAKVSQFTVQNLLIESGMERSSAIMWAVPIGAHHGRLHNARERGLSGAPGMSVDNNLTRDAEWEEQRKRIARRLVEHLGELPTSAISRASPHLWWLAGLISVADWVGSDERYFPVDENLGPDQSRAHARSAVESIGFNRPVVRPAVEFDELFGFAANDLQVQALEALKEPGIYVIEAPMGMGKTEAALACAYRLISEGKASGIYFALPTQATSNRIHLRVNDFLRVVCGLSQATRLIHANSWLVDPVAHPVPSATALSDPSEDARTAHDWFASAKRALLAPFGVGTVDQALLSVVAAKHFFVRRFGLAGKVVILDEVHSYDFYTGTLIHVLCDTLEALGCTVILLSATLTPERRGALLGESETSDITAYPLITGRQSGGTFIKPRRVEPQRDNPVRIVFVKSAQAVHEAWRKARQGACILWICDTVASAQVVYAQLEAFARGDDLAPALGLLHSRFPLFRREQLEAYWMEALGKEGEASRLRPAGCILISTQVVEQSVDLDADLLVTELAPTDMLLQRIGRLWRHPRDWRPTECAECWILQESATLDELRAMNKDAIREALGAKARVYAPYVLLRSLEVWSSRQVIQIPKHIRDLLKETYAERDDEPKGWRASKEEIQGEGFAKRQIAHMAANIWNPMLDDQEGVQTRVTEVKTVQLILAIALKGRQLALLNGDLANLADGAFRLDTARALHRNLVKVPKSAFATFRREETTHRYVKGEQAIAWVQHNGRLKIAGMKEGNSLYWHSNHGLEIRRGEDGEVDHEPCD